MPRHMRSYALRTATHSEYPYPVVMSIIWLFLRSILPTIAPELLDIMIKIVSQSLLPMYDRRIWRQ